MEPPMKNTANKGQLRRNKEHRKPRTQLNRVDTLPINGQNDNFGAKQDPCCFWDGGLSNMQATFILKQNNSPMAYC